MPNLNISKLRLRDYRCFPALDIELTNHQDTDFDLNLKVLQVLLSWSAVDKK